jgi:uncharacterized protein (TIGR02118 family)
VHKLLVLHYKPDDVEEARRYYRDVHIPLCAKMSGLVSFGYSFDLKSPMGGDTPFFCAYEAVFESEEAMGKVFQTDAAKRVVEDAANFATDGSIVIHYSLHE